MAEALRAEFNWRNPVDMLANLAPRLGELGRKKEALAVAQEAVESFTELAQVWPDRAGPRSTG